MAHPGTIDSVRYLNRGKLDSEQRLQKGWFRELIHHYGVDATYFRHNAGPFLTSGSNFDHVFGEQPSMGYWLNAPIIVFMESQGDSMLLSKWGIETDGDIEAFIVMDDFTDEFRDLVGAELTNTFSTSVVGTVISGAVSISGTVADAANGLSGYILDSVSGLTSGTVSGVWGGSFNRFEVPYHNLFYKSDAYTEQVVTGTSTGNWSGTLDADLSGIVSGTISSTFTYHTNQYPSDEDGGVAPNWEIAPKVDDFFRLDFEDSNHEEYTITKVINRDIGSDGINPLLYKYIWRMSCVRRDPSSEEVDGATDGVLNPAFTDIGGRAEEEETPDQSFHNSELEDASNDIFDYDIQIIDSTDGVNSDSAFGDYDRR